MVKTERETNKLAKRNLMRIESREKEISNEETVEKIINLAQ